MIYLLIILIFPHVHQSQSIWPRKNEPQKITSGQIAPDTTSDQVNSDSQESNFESSPPSATGSKFRDDGEAAIYQAPSDLEVVRLNDTSVVLKWDLPFLSAEHLQFFKIQYKSTRKEAVWKTDIRDIPPTTKAYQINGLRPGNYFFIVYAVYDNDDNVASDQFKFRLRARSKIPNDQMPEQKAPQIFWSEAEYDYFRFKWKYNVREQDMPSFGYLVYYRSAHAVTDFVIYNTIEESVEIAYLEPETPYEAKVVAYNSHAVSEFSDTIRIKTKPKSNSTTTTAIPTTASVTLPYMIISTTKKPYETGTISYSADSKNVSDSESRTSDSSITNSPSIPPRIPPSVNFIKPSSGRVPSVGLFSNQTSTNIGQSIPVFIDKIFWSQDEPFVAARYVLYILLALLFFTLILLCWINFYQRQNQKRCSPTSSRQSMQFDLEINCYFKNSFPGVEGEEYSSNS